MSLLNEQCKGSLRLVDEAPLRQVEVRVGPQLDQVGRVGGRLLVLVLQLDIGGGALKLGYRCRGGRGRGFSRLL